MSRPLKFVSFNARGLRDAVKRRAVFRHLHIKYPGHLAILQETHSAADVESRWMYVCVYVFTTQAPPLI